MATNQRNRGSVPGRGTIFCSPQPRTSPGPTVSAILMHKPGPQLLGMSYWRGAYLWQGATLLYFTLLYFTLLYFTLSKGGLSNMRTENPFNAELRQYLWMNKSISTKYSMDGTDDLEDLDVDGVIILHDRQRTIHAILWHVRVTIFCPWKSSITYCECVSVALVIQYAKRMGRIILSTEA